jgi:hypothetical protein
MVTPDLFKLICTTIVSSVRDSGVGPHGLSGHYFGSGHDSGKGLEA